MLEYNVVVMGIQLGPKNCVLIPGKHTVQECKFRVCCCFIAGHCVEELIVAHVASVF